MKTASATAFLNIDLATEGDKAPEWVELLPRGPKVNARDGRSWTYEPQVLIAAFAANNGPLPIDFEHGQDILGPKGQAAPAAGWITAVEERSGSLWGKVEWTATAATMIVERAYRFLSPSMRHNAQGVILRLAGAGLVNRPALEMTALSRELETPPQENAMSLKAIAKALGLKEDADEAAVLAELKKRDDEQVALASALGLGAKFVPADITAMVGTMTTELATATAALKDAEDPTEVSALRTQLTETRTALAAMQEKDLNRDIDTALDTEVKAGKIAPASREQYRAMCAEKGGLERFKSLAATLPVIFKPTDLDNAEITATANQSDKDPVALASAARKYQDEQLALGRKITMTEAVRTIQEQAQ